MLPENFRKIGRTGKSGLFRYGSDTGLALEKERQAFFNTVIEKIVKQGFVHAFLEKTAAFTAADVDLCGEILERQMLHIMAVDVVEQNAEPLNITRCRRVLGFTGKRCVAVNLNPDRQQKLLDFHLKRGRLRKREVVDPQHTGKYLVLPVDLRRKDDGGELHIRQHRFDVARLDHTV